MIKESDLTTPNKHGLNIIKTMNLIAQYMYLGKTYKHKNRYYRMDGDCNPYIVPLKEDFKTPMDRGEDVIPLFQNENFWNLLIDMAADIDKETLTKIKFEVASSRIINNCK